MRPAREGRENLAVEAYGASAAAGFNEARP